MSQDARVRSYIYKRFVEAGSPPPVGETADALGLSLGDAEASYRRLDESHAIVLDPGTLDIWMANPLSAKPTPFRVEAGSRGRWWGVCAWDALGVLAMLDADGIVLTACADCDEPMTVGVERGALVDGGGVAHFVVPAARWWDDIGFT